MECGFGNRMETLGRHVQARARGEQPPAPELMCRLSVGQPQDSQVERSLDRAGSVLNLLTTENFLGTMFAPLSMAGGVWSLARAQNVSGREAHFKAMAMDAAFYTVAIRDGKVPPESDFPTPTEAAVGQRILGTNDLSATFHNGRERALFEKTFRDTVDVLIRAGKTPDGRAQLQELVKAYRAWGRAHPTSATAGFFLQGR
ncbi:hypothetical protein KKC22_19070 [Myxococcota bacterium]|nr:hypothetical protein [Myxococcota bacterium]